MATTLKDTSRVYTLAGAESFMLPPGHLLLDPLSDEIEVGSIVAVGRKNTRAGILLNQGPPVGHSIEYPLGSVVHHIKSNSMEIEVDGRRYHVVHWMDVRLVVPQNEKSNED